jgi:hypothetical protein
MTWRQVDANDAAWRAFVIRFLVFFFGGLAVVLGLLVLIDPFDSGRFPSLPITGVSDRTQRSANVSLGRSAKFNAAIFGNSHGQLLDPQRLSQATGLSFVQLTVPGAHAPEQIATMKWFIRHHPRIGAIVVAADDRWCSDNPQPWHEFPFWLYGESDFVYLAHLLSTRPLTAGYRRLRFALGLVAPSDPRGYDDYEVGVADDYRFDFPSAPPPSDGVAASAVDLGDRRFPAIEQLAQVMAALPQDPPLVILFPPQFYTTLPTAGRRIAELNECKTRLSRLAAGLPRRGFLDFFLDSPMNRDPKNYDDLEHYKAPVARKIEAEIARVLNGTSSR